MCAYPVQLIRTGTDEAIIRITRALRCRLCLRFSCRCELSCLPLRAMERGRSTAGAYALLKSHHFNLFSLLPLSLLAAVWNRPYK